MEKSQLLPGFYWNAASWRSQQCPEVLHILVLKGLGITFPPWAASSCQCQSLSNPGWWDDQEYKLCLMLRGEGMQWQGFIAAGDSVTLPGYSQLHFSLPKNSPESVLKFESQFRSFPGVWCRGFIRGWLWNKEGFTQWFILFSPRIPIIFPSLFGLSISRFPKTATVPVCMRGPKKSHLTPWTDGYFKMFKISTTAWSCLKCKFYFWSLFPRNHSQAGSGPACIPPK